MRSPRRFATAMVAAAAVGAATIGVTAAVAQQDEATPSGTDDAGLLERLADLEQQLPAAFEEIDEPDAEDASSDDWRDYADVFAGFEGDLAPAEDDLRRLFVDADDADGEVADAVATVASGWLDVTNALESFSVVASHDLEFPLETSDDQGVATGADPLRGIFEHGVTLLLQGVDKHLDGYTTLRDVGGAEPAIQAAIDGRAADAERFDADSRPVLVHQLSQGSTTVLVPLGRFETKGPGVDARATSLSYVCIDRELFEAETRPLTDDVLAELEAATPERADCGEFGVLTESD